MKNFPTNGILDRRPNTAPFIFSPMLGKNFLITAHAAMRGPIGPSSMKSSALPTSAPIDLTAPQMKPPIPSIHPQILSLNAQTSANSAVTPAMTQPTGPLYIASSATPMAATVAIIMPLYFGQSPMISATAPTSRPHGPKQISPMTPAITPTIASAFGPRLPQERGYLAEHPAGLRPSPSRTPSPSASGL